MNLPLEPLLSSKAKALALLVLAAVPPLYLLVAIQYSAITVPFWDHTELIRWIVSWDEGSFHFSSLWAPHNHTRPFVYRLVMVFNAVLTGWDIRSEYIYMYLAIYGTCACHAWVIHRLLASAIPPIVFSRTLLLSSLILFSPVGHNNHWWSMMFQLNATNLFIALTFVTAFAWPARWCAHITAAASCWLAAFTLTNGFFAMVAVIVVFQLSASRILRPDRFALFWAVNLIVVAAFYLPGMTMDSSSTHPGILKLGEFSLAYLGAPLAGLLWFPYRNMFHIPVQTWPNVVCGVILLVTCAGLSWNAWPRLRERNLAAMILFGFAGFAMMSAVATGWARAAFDEIGVSNGNASRYTIFAAYLLLGQIYYVAAGFGNAWWPRLASGVWSRGINVVAPTIFVILSFVSYGRATRVYADAHQFNTNLSQAYDWGLQPTAEDKYIYPDPVMVGYIKRTLQLHEIGPYGNRPRLKDQVATGKFVQPVLLGSGRKVTQRLVASRDGLKNISLRFVTPSGRATDGTVAWLLTEADNPTPIASGSFDARGVVDWAAMRIKLPYIESSKNHAYDLTLSGSGGDGQAVGLPLYEPVATSHAAVLISDRSDTSLDERFATELTMEYVR
ncbi:MAG TPA: hypothetical protein VIQ29_25205 [Ancylobacter sp.]